MTVVLRSLALLAVCLLDDTAPQGVERPATAKAVLDDLEQALELRRAGDATDSESLLIARAAVALLGCAHAHGASRLARELVKRAWGLSCAQAPPSAAAYRVILCAVTGEEEDDDDEDESEEEEDDDESMMDESDVSDSEMMAGRDSVGFSELGDDVPLEDGDDIEVKGDDVMALLEEVDGEDARKERDAHRKAGRPTRGARNSSFGCGPWICWSGVLVKMKRCGRSLHYHRWPRSSRPTRRPRPPISQTVSRPCCGGGSARPLRRPTTRPRPRRRPRFC